MLGSVNASVMLADGAGDAPLNGVCDAVLIYEGYWCTSFRGILPVVIYWVTSREHNDNITEIKVFFPEVEHFI